MKTTPLPLDSLDEPLGPVEQPLEHRALLVPLGHRGVLKVDEYVLEVALLERTQQGAHLWGYGGAVTGVWWIRLWSCGGAGGTIGFGWSRRSFWWVEEVRQGSIKRDNDWWKKNEE
jgi:hypothetical protein